MIPSQKILIGDVRETIKQIPSDSCHCIITSPPYFQLRRYGDDPREIGLEKTPAEFVANMVALFREVRRVLREDGTCWVNLGDSYFSPTKGSGGSNPEASPKQAWKGSDNGQGFEPRRISAGDTGCKPKDLIGIPWMLAFALRSDGWYLRSEIIWEKPNCLPESVIDRPNRNHEYIFLLSKQKKYFYDCEAVKEPCSGTANSRGNGINPKAKTPGRNGSFFQDRDPQHPEARKSRQNESFSGAINGLLSMRNKRSVWSVPVAPFRDAHFATYPADLIKPCILAGTSEKGCCAACGTPYERIVELGEPDIEHQLQCGGDEFGGYNGKSQKDYENHKAQNASETKARILAGMRERKTVGWEKTCKCTTTGIVPCTVFDPFAGSGTTGQVAGELGRNFIGCELYDKFLPMIKQRTAEPGLML